MTEMDIKSRRGLHDGDVRDSESPTLKARYLNSGSPRPVKTPIKINASDHESESESELEEEQSLSRRSSLEQSDPSSPTKPTQESPRPRKSFQKKDIHLESYSLPNTGHNQSLPSSNLKWIVLAILLILPVVAFSKIFVQKSERKSCNFDQLRKRAPLQSMEVWKALTINIELLLNKMSKSPNIYLLMHSSESNDKKMQKLIEDIASETSKCFDGERPIEMRLEDFQTKAGDDYGYPIEQYKKKLKEGSVFLIVNLNDIPPNSARALHTICDSHSPIAPDVVIFLSLRTHLSTANGSPADIAYQTLQQLWQKVPDNELDALITRVIDQVLLLQG